jgi:hypothetical protein
LENEEDGDEAVDLEALMEFVRLGTAGTGLAH